MNNTPIASFPAEKPEIKEERVIKLHAFYKHFKGTIVEIIEVAELESTGEFLVIYRHCADNSVWARPKNEFLGEVDHEKYPDVKQKYRFEEYGDSLR